jgi:hypothetical protein
MTASTADLVARISWVRTHMRPKGHVPEHAVPFTAIAVATAYALLFLPTGNISYIEAAVAAVLGAMLLSLALAWPIVPAVASIGVPVGYIALASVLRDAAGGGTSGFGGLFLLPVL